MRFNKTLVILVLAVSPIAAASANPDTAECEVEAVAAAPGISQFQYDSFSADGQQIAIGWQRGDNERGTYLLNLETGARRDIDGLNNGATFSPDGRTLVNSVYVEDGTTDIAIVDLETGELEIIAAHENYDWLPSYSPDGKKVLFNSFRSGRSDVYLYDVASKQLERVTSSDFYEAHAQFSPDGKHISFHERDADGDFSVVVVELASGREVLRTTERGEESYASWSPDGKFLAFASDRYGEQGLTDVFVMNLDGEVLQRITDHPKKDAYPFWSPDGSHLYFNSDREPQGVYRVAMRAQIRCEPAAGE